MIFGTINANPNNPYNTEGIPANNSTAGEIIFATFLVQFQLKILLLIMPIGTPINKAPIVPNIDAIIIGNNSKLI